jgi:2-polyprenyl-3-methyl-5-hydroxy-6-metoxy-1,4-benzoquinol methylase
MRQILQSLSLRLRKAAALRRPLPAKGYAPAPAPVPRVEQLQDDELRQLNELLPWQCFTVDSTGRRFGDRAWAGKREEPQAIPDRRIELLDANVPLAGRGVLEIGCFEGVHTIGLCQLAREVLAVDARVENVVKTMVRCGFHGQTPDVRVCNVESPEQLAALGAVDVVHHVGVLYHLHDPVRHLRVLAPLVGDALMLDTHVARDEEARDEYESDGRRFRYRRLVESGAADAFSGVYDHAKWLTCSTLVELLRESGFATVDVHERRDERNGLRVLIFAYKGERRSAPVA